MSHSQSVVVITMKCFKLDLTLISRYHCHRFSTNEWKCVATICYVSTGGSVSCFHELRSADNCVGGDSG